MKARGGHSHGVNKMDTETKTQKGKNGKKERGEIVGVKKKRETNEWRRAVILDFESFTRRRLQEDHAHPAETWVKRQHGENRGCKIRKEAVEDRDHRPVCHGKVIGP